MTAKVLSVIAVVLAFRGSYLINKSKTVDESNYGRLVSISACLLTLLALYMRE